MKSILSATLSRTLSERSKYPRVNTGSMVLVALLGLSSFSAHADVVTDWNQHALRATDIASMPPPVQARAMAIVHAAMYDAVNAIDQRHAAYWVNMVAPAGTSQESAVATAAHGILFALVPVQKAMLDAALKTTLSKIPDSQGKNDGMLVGSEVASKLLELRKTDGADAKTAYSMGSGAGVYQATPPMNIAPVLPHWRYVKPFILKNASQFQFAGPDAPSSKNFEKDFNEIKKLGSSTSTARTSEQTAIAIHWSGSEIPPFNAVARSISTEKNLGIADNARMFAHLNMAMADALIAVFEAKYTFNSWRPVTAIRSTNVSFNKALVTDVGWEPLIVTPPHPEYGCAHCISAGAAIPVLRKFSASDKISASYVYPVLGVPRKWSSLTQIAKEMEDARVWGGVHFRTASEHGTQVGYKIGEYTLANFMLPVKQ